MNGNTWRIPWSLGSVVISSLMACIVNTSVFTHVFADEHADVLADGRADVLAPSIVLSTPTPKVYVGDRVIIDVEATAVEDELDFDSLWRQLELERQTQGTRIAVIAGKVVEVRIWRFEAVANVQGEITLGPLATGEIRSNSVTTSVLAAPEVRWTPTTDDVALNVTWSKTNAYVQEQLILTISLRHRYPITHLQVDQPEFSGFRVIPLIKDKRTEHEDERGRVLEFVRRYALFAQRSDDITIAKIEARGSIIKSRLERADFVLSSAPQTLAIAPAPAAAKGQWWLPAADLSTLDEWSKDRRWLAAGEQVTRTVSLMAQGVSAEQLPDLVMPQVRGLTMNLIDTQRITDARADGVNATARFIYNVRALSPVPVFPDPIRVYWWNTEQDRAATAIVRTGRIDIGAPSRDALMELVADSRNPYDVLANHKGTLWLVCISLVLVALLAHAYVGQWSARTALRTCSVSLRLWFEDLRLCRASLTSSKQFLAAVERWRNATNCKTLYGDVAAFDRVLDAAYSTRASEHSRLEAARALIAARRAKAATTAFLHS